MAPKLGEYMEIYHNPRCSKSREALSIIQHRNPEIIFYLKQPLTHSDITKIISRLDDPLEDLVRWGDKEAPQKPSIMDVKSIIAILIDNPKLLQRPIIDDGVIARICRSPQKARNYT